MFKHDFSLIDLEANEMVVSSENKKDLRIKGLSFVYL